MERKERRFYSSVSGLATATDSYIVPSGKMLSVEEFGGNAATHPDTTVRIVWDYGGASPEILFATHGDMIRQPIGINVLGNGVKVIAIILVNDQAASTFLGGFWIGNES